MEVAIKSLNIAPKILSKRSNDMWNILLATEEEAKKLAGCILVIFEASNAVYGNLEDESYTS